MLHIFIFLLTCFTLGAQSTEIVAATTSIKMNQIKVKNKSQTKIVSFLKQHKLKILASTAVVTGLTVTAFLIWKNSSNTQLNQQKSNKSASNKKYRNAVDFVLDKNPHFPDNEEAFNICIGVENGFGDCQKSACVTHRKNGPGYLASDIKKAGAEFIWNRLREEKARNSNFDPAQHHREGIGIRLFNNNVEIIHLAKTTGELKALQRLIGNNIGPHATLKHQ